MAITYQRFGCSPEAVFGVLADGWLYPTWVVGASRMRDVDSGWPQPGARLRHSVGIWPLLINDSTSCLVWDPPRRMAMQARGWPLGAARVDIEVSPSPDGCIVRMQEDAVSGPARMVPRVIADMFLRPRNRETLRRLASLAEGRAVQPQPSGE